MYKPVILTTNSLKRTYLEIFHSDRRGREGDLKAIEDELGRRGWEVSTTPQFTRRTHDRY